VQREFVEDGREPERHLLPLEAGVLGLDGVVAQEPRGLEFDGDIIAVSRILAASKVVVIANTSTTQAFTGHVLVDMNLTPPATQLSVAYSNQAGAPPPSAAVLPPAGSVSVTDGTNQSSGCHRYLADQEVRPRRLTTTPWGPSAPSESHCGRWKSRSSRHDEA